MISVPPAEPASWETEALKSVPRIKGAGTSAPGVGGRIGALVALSSVTRMTRMFAAVRVFPSIAPPAKRTDQYAVVENPSSALMVATVGWNGFAGRLSVPSVLPLKYKSFGYGKMPFSG